jgi:hypothetical protein
MQEREPEIEMMLLDIFQDDYHSDGMRVFS